MPLPRGDEDSTAIEYLRMIIVDFIQSTSRIYAMGFSQNAMMALYATACFPDYVVGVNQGSSGLAVKGSGVVLFQCV